MPPVKRWFAEATNPEKRAGAPARRDRRRRPVRRPLRRARDGPEALKRMNRDAMVFAMANPNPEITPEEAAPYARVIATGRSDYPNQINNVLCFPGIFRGALDVRARDITEEMKMAAARGIASIVADDELREDYVIPSVFNRDVADAVAARRRRPGQGPGRRRRRAATRSATRAARPRSSAPSAPERRTPDMRITITGASGLIGTGSTSARTARRRGHDALAQDERDPCRRPRARGAARRPRRDRPPRGRERRPALDRREPQGDPRVARDRARATSSRASQRPTRSRRR